MADPREPSNDPPHPRGVDSVMWDNLGEGWRMTCLCGWVTLPSPDFVDAAEDMQAHWEGDQ